MSKISCTDMIDVRYRQSGDQHRFGHCASFCSKGKDERIRVAICDLRSSSALIERPHTACRLRNLADFIFSTTTIRRRRWRRWTTVRELISHGASVPAESSISPNMAWWENGTKFSASSEAASFRFSMTRVIFSAIVISVELAQIFGIVSFELNIYEKHIYIYKYIICIFMYICIFYLIWWRKIECIKVILFFHAI